MMIDLKTLVVGQCFTIEGGYAPDMGTVARIEPPFIYVDTYWGQLRFDANGDECNPDDTLAEGHYESPFSLPFKPRLGNLPPHITNRAWCKQ